MKGKTASGTYSVRFAVTSKKHFEQIMLAIFFIVLGRCSGLILKKVDTFQIKLDTIQASHDF